MNNRLTILLIISLLTTAPANADDMVLEIIPLQHRVVSDVITIIRPLVAEGGTVTGMNNQLIVKTTPANLAEIKQILGSIDQSPRKLMISVRQDIDSNTHINKSGVSASYASDDISVAAGETQSHEDLLIRGKDDEGNVIQYRLQNLQSQHEDKNVFRVQTLEGHPAYIMMGQSVPVPDQTTYVTPTGVVIREGTAYHDAASGFYVLPRMQGDQVTLFVSPRLSRADSHQNAVFDFQNIETSASGRLGEWILIGGAVQDFNDSNSRNLSSAQRRGQEQRAVLIKVDEIK
ncbi:MAG: hypothetical protein A2W28_04350 [Gammaproteobacteria bacterium RBG_16_51_14]|nr:MAG: hypothetical protein A2W28_04350 [Gammaproteobacteria bacterium RBG_16_51_14]